MILTLCGSAKFEPYWHEANKQLGLAGHISFSLMTFPSVEKEKTWYTPEQKWTLDLAHLAKIEESDGVVMLNIESYLGESSSRELEWARMREKHIFWTCPDNRKKDNEFFARELIHPRMSGEWVELLSAIKNKSVTS